jgi:hypothetical protein
VLESEAEAIDAYPANPRPETRIHLLNPGYLSLHYQRCLPCHDNRCPTTNSAGVTRYPPQLMRPMLARPLATRPNTSINTTLRGIPYKDGVNKAWVGVLPDGWGISYPLRWVLAHGCWCEETLDDCRCGGRTVWLPMQRRNTKYMTIPTGSSPTSSLSRTPSTLPNQGCSANSKQLYAGTPTRSLCSLPRTGPISSRTQS